MFGFAEGGNTCNFDSLYIDIPPTMSAKQKGEIPFDPDDIGLAGNNLFGLPFTETESDIVIVPVPWDVTTSYAKGTAQGPDAIMQASLQVDLYNVLQPELWKRGIFMRNVPHDWLKKNYKLGRKADKIIAALEKGRDISKNQQLQKDLDEINHFSSILNDWVYVQTRSLLKKDKKVGLLGGEHSVPLGYLRALGDKYENFSILQIDAHADLRKSFEGFTYSHASIFYNALKEVPQIEKLVQMGVRDMGFKELKRIEKNDKITCFFDHALKERLFEGDTWKAIVDDIILQLGDKVYISFDIDGLEPSLCPTTGTPVPGGFSYEQIQYLLKRLKKSGKEVIGFDLCEVAPGENEWDANVGARVLYMLCACLG